MLVERESWTVIGVCRRVLGDLTEAEDAAQDTFARAIQSLATYRGDGPVGAWLRRIALRVAIARLAARRQITRPDDELVDPRVARLTSGENPETLYLGREYRADVIDAIAALPVAQRDVVLLRFFDDLTLEDIARVTDKPIGTVKSRLSRGVSTLQTSPAQGPPRDAAERSRPPARCFFRARHDSDRLDGDPVPDAISLAAVRAGSGRDALAAVTVAWHLATQHDWPVAPRVRARSFALVLGVATILGTGSMVAASAAQVIVPHVDRTKILESRGSIILEPMQLQLPPTSSARPHRPPGRTPRRWPFQCPCRRQSRSGRARTRHHRPGRNIRPMAVRRRRMTPARARTATEHPPIPRRTTTGPDTAATGPMTGRRPTMPPTVMTAATAATTDMTVEATIRSTTMAGHRTTRGSASTRDTARARTPRVTLT